MDSERWEAIRAEGIWVSAMVVLLAPITYAALLFVETELCTGVDLWFKQGTWQLRYCQVSFPLRLAVTAMFAVLGGALGSFLARKRRVSGGRGRHVEHAVELHRIQASMERASNR